MTTSLPAGADSRLGYLLARLGYVDDADYVTDPSYLDLTQVSHAVESAFASMGVIGAFCPRSSLGAGSLRRVPIVYVVTAESTADAAAKHRAIWSQSVVPLLIIGTPMYFQVCNGFDYRAGGQEWPWEVLQAQTLPAALVSLTSSAIRSSAAWGNFKMPTRVDERLGNAIRALSADLRARSPALKDHPGAINNAIGRFLYLYMLVDRGILNQEWVDTLTSSRGRPACPSVNLHEGFGEGDERPAPWAATEVWHLFDAIDDVLNGSIFPLSKGQRRLLDNETLYLIRRALRADTIDAGSQQYGFLDINYATIRTETVSAIYECFFELEAESDKRAQGAFYTPPFLVDYILDEIDAIEPIRSTSKLVDPACGSGAFLVGGFRRIIEHERRQGCPIGARRLREILSSAIMGIEIKQQAANVARFSLYLTMLDYLPGVTLANVADVMEGEKLFPDLIDRLIVRDTFQALPEAMRNTASHVLGNPPWTKIESDGAAKRYRTRLLHAGGEDLPPFLGATGTSAETFFWRALRDICAPGGHIAFVLPTKAFIAPVARCFPDAIAARTTIHGMTNLAHFRERLFTNAREAATVVFAAPKPAGPLHWTWRYSPKASSQPIGPDGIPWAIVVDRGQVERFRQSDLLLDGHEWFRDLMLQPLDRMLATMLEKQHVQEKALNINGFLNRSGMSVRVGDSPARLGLPADQVLNTKSTDYRERLGLLPGSTRNYVLPPEFLSQMAESYRLLFRGPTLLMTRNQTGFHVEAEPVAFSSSLVGVYFLDERVPVEKRSLILAQISAYLQTSVARYLLALFGRLWVFDQRRFEPPDIRHIPFPYLDHEELLAEPVTSFNDKSFTKFCQKRFGMDDLFALAVAEHHELREKYQDGKRPAEGSAIVTDVKQKAYEGVLIDELTALLAGAPVTVKRDVSAQPQSIAFRIVIDPTGKFHSIPKAESFIQEFAEEGAVELWEAEGVALASMIKPNMLSAFTAERAYADALRVAQRILAG